MKIALVTHRSWPGIGGAETYVRVLALELATKHEVTVVAHRIDDGPSTRLTDSLLPPPTFEPFQDGPVRVTPLRIPSVQRAALTPLAYQSVPGLRRYAYRPLLRGPAATLYAAIVGPVIKAAAPESDIVHVFSGGFLGAAAVRAAHLLDVPAVATGFLHRHSWGDDAISAAVYRRTDQVVAQLRTEADIYRELGVREDQISICGSGSPGLRTGGGSAMRDRHDIRGPLVVFLGVRRPGKGADLLLRAAPILAERIDNVTVAFVGPGDALPTQAGKARVIDVGSVRIDDPDRDAWVDAADVVALPSDAESFGICVVEAWSLRKPVVVSDIPTLRELVESGAGVVVQRHPDALAAGLERVLTDPSLSAELGERGYRRWQNRYTSNQVARCHDLMYETLRH